MTLTSKTFTLLAAATLAFSFHSSSFAQSSYKGGETIETEVLKLSIPETRTARAASWQGQELALAGVDVVSFYSEDGPTDGSKDFFAKYDDTTWRFSSEENRDLFQENPTKYVPEFGGFCPVALASNNAKVGKSTHYTVVNDKLYLNYNSASQYKFRKGPDEFLVRAQLNF